MGLVKPALPRLQQGNPLGIGLAGAWPLYEGSGLVLHDLSGRQHNGLHNASWASGPFGSAIFLNGAQILDLGGWQRPQNAMTASVWINPSSPLVSNEVLFDDDTDPGGGALQPGYTQWFFDASGVLHIRIQNLDTGPWIGRTTAAGAIVANKWQMVTGVWDGGLTASAVKIYVNAVRVDTTDDTGGGTFTGPYSGVLADLWFGAQNYGNGGAGQPASFYTGLLDFPLMYYRALSASDIAQLYFDSFAPFRKPSRWWEVVGAPPVFRPGQYDDQLSLTQAGWFDPLL